MNMSYLPAEWHKQSLIQLTWPHKDTDWACMLEEVNTCFLKIAYEVLKRQNLLIVAPDPDSIRNSIDNYGADIQKLITSKIKHIRIFCLTEVRGVVQLLQYNQLCTCRRHLFYIAMQFAQIMTDIICACLLDNSYFNRSFHTYIY
jgi:hypothetical protein